VYAIANCKPLLAGSTGKNVCCVSTCSIIVESGCSFSTDFSEAEYVKFERSKVVNFYHNKAKKILNFAKINLINRFTHDKIEKHGEKDRKKLFLFSLLIIFCMLIQKKAVS
jgi:hypothetical protein